MDAAAMVKAKLPAEITSYDLLKAAAVIIMIIDHIGYYFFIDEMWWRAIGRIGFPVWFFLVGYARGRDLSPKLWLGAVILIAGNAAAGMYMFPMNALVTIILIRIVLDPYIRLSMVNKQAMIAFSFVLALMILPTNMFVEYGTQALIMAVFGYLVRHKEEIKDSLPLLNAYMMFALGTFLLMQHTVFLFSQPQWFVMTIGTLIVMGTLLFFKSVTFPKLTAALPFILTAPIKFMGRRTLEIYVVHLIAFKIAVIFLYPDQYQLFDWTWFYQFPEEVTIEQSIEQ